LIGNSSRSPFHLEHPDPCNILRILGNLRLELIPLSMLLQVVEKGKAAGKKTVRWFNFSGVLSIKNYPDFILLIQSC
jgi:hypothetical protein